MKKILIYSTCAVLTLSGCYSGAGQGAYAGASLGSIIGSAIGGINGGHRGSDVGTLIGMAGGAIVGAAVGSAADREQASEYNSHKAAIYGNEGSSQSDNVYGRQSKRHSAYVPGGDLTQDDGSGFDPNNGGDDRIEMEAPAQGNGEQTAYHVAAPKTTVEAKSVSLDELSKLSENYTVKSNPKIEIRNAAFQDANGNGSLEAGETGKVTFEIMNHTGEVLRDVVPTVIETTGNKRVHISPSIRVESIAPGQGVRYTATVATEKKLKEGAISIKVTVTQNGNEITSKVLEFEVVTKRG